MSRSNRFRESENVFINKKRRRRIRRKKKIGIY